MLVSVRILSKLSKEFENVSLRKIVDSISNESYKQYDEKVEDTTARRRSGDKYPTYDPEKNRKPAKYLQMHRDEYLNLILHLFKSYVEVYRTNDILAALLSENKGASKNFDYRRYKELLTKIEKEQNFDLDFDRMFKDFTKLKASTKEFASTDMIPVLPLVKCHNVYLEPSEFVRCQEDLENLVKLKEIVDQNVQLGEEFKLWRTAVSEYFTT